jgi:SNF2 family DNA or RNA helicase
LGSEGHRTLVFSQSKKMLDIIATVLRARGTLFLRLDGDVTKIQARQRLIDTFQTNPKYTVMLLTTQVGQQCMP